MCLLFYQNSLLFFFIVVSLLFSCCLNNERGHFGVRGQIIGDGSANPTISLLPPQNMDDRYGGGFGVVVQNLSELVTQTFDGQDQVFAVSSSLYNLNALCYAPYPVAWFLQDDFQYNAIVVWQARIDTRRIAPDVFDHTTFNYTSTLALFGDSNNKMTGRYICRSTRYSNLSTSAFIFWQGIGQQYLVHSQENITISMEEVNSGVIVLPCFVSSPKITAILFKFEDGGSIELRLNDTISFDPKIGFTLTNLPNPGGVYKCVTNTRKRDYDYVMFNVPGLPKPPQIIKPTPAPTRPTTTTPIPTIQTNLTIKNPPKPTPPPTTTTTTTTTPAPTPPPPPKLKSKPTLVYNPQKQEMVCCTGGGIKKAPQLYHYFCDQPQMCNYRTRAVTSRLWHEFGGRKTRKNGCATFKLHPYSNGILRCLGDDFELQKEYIFPFSSTFLRFNGGKRGPPQNQTAVHPWMSWSQISPEEMMVIQLSVPRRHLYRTRVVDPNQDVAQDSSPAVIYEGQIVKLECHISTYYFASGIKWAVKFKNNTVKIVDTAFEKDGPNTNIDIVMSHNGHADVLTLTAYQEIEKVSCLAPVWNSSFWIIKAMNFVVQQSSLPTITNVSDPSPTWYLNDTQKTMSCVATSSPVSTFTWLKDNQTIQNGTNLEILSSLEFINSTNITGSSLIIRRVSHSSPGIYTCQANNLAGFVSKSFTVTVLESTWKKTLTICIGVFVGLALLVLIAFLGWKIKVGHILIGQLSGGGGGGGSGVGTSSVNSHPSLSANDLHNRSFDPSSNNMNRELLD